MKTFTKYGKYLIVAASFLVFGSLLGCSTTKTRTVSSEVVVDRIYSNDTSPVVDYIWEEPMIDVVDVPPGLDPEGIYYRPAHQEVIEIRQGRWRYYKKPVN